MTEEVVIVKIKEMKLDDLINMLWAALEVNRGSNLFFETIEGHLTKQLRVIKDEQFEMLMTCFDRQGEDDTKASEKMSSRFLDLVIKVVREKRDRFSARTLVNFIWSCAKIDFSSNMHKIRELLEEFAGYDRLIKELPEMR